MGTIAVSSLGHHTISGFHAHGGTAITSNLGRARPTPIVRDGVVDIAPVVRLNLCAGHRVLDSASGRSGAGTGGGSVPRKISTDVCVVLDQLRERRTSHVAGTGSQPPVRSTGHDPVLPPMEVPRPILLRTLTDAAAVHPHFMLVRPAGATDLLRSGGKVTGVSARRPDGDNRVTAGAAGRSGNILGRPGLADRKLPIQREVHLGAKHATAAIAARPGTVRGRNVVLAKYFSGNPVLLVNRTVVMTEEGHALDRALRQRAETAAGVRRVD
jgi:hypothetical protein